MVNGAVLGDVDRAESESPAWSIHVKGVTCHVCIDLGYKYTREARLKTQLK